MASQIQSYFTKLFVVLAIAKLASSGAMTSVDELTPDQKNSYLQFKEKVIDTLPHDYMKDDFYLIRWMEAKKFNVADALEMLQSNLVWREKNDMDNILAEDFSDVSEEFWMNTEHHDKMGRPVGYAKVGAWPIRNGVLSGKKKRIIRYNGHFQESLTQNVLKLREKGTYNATFNFIIIADMENFNTIQSTCPLCLPVLLRFIDGMETNYPGFLEEIVLLNSPPPFMTVVAAAKDILSENTRKAMRIFDMNRDKWLAYLDERIDKDERFESFGGTILQNA